VPKIDDAGEQRLRAGYCVGFEAAERNGHPLRNRSEREALLRTIGARDDCDGGESVDIDSEFSPGRDPGSGGNAREDGTRYRFGVAGGG
jgi:uncharacterized cupin superfamily protein